MKEYQQRVIDEKKELDARLNRLESFIMSLAFDDVDDLERSRLVQQKHIMVQYSMILEERILAF